MTLTIAGAGLAGLLAGNMLSRRAPVIMEAQAALPNNHSAVLRFRSSVVGDTLNIPFRKVSMIKTAAPWRNPVADALSYSFKASGMSRSDRSINQGFVAEDRFIAPPDLIQRMAASCPNILFGHECEFFEGEGPFISTIPMPALMQALEYPGREAIEFKSQSGINVKASIRKCDAYTSLLVPNPAEPFTRISITGDEMIIECTPDDFGEVSSEHVLARAAILLGIDESRIHSDSQHKSRYAKILPIPDDARKAFMFWATDKHKIFSLGRFATWRPNLLLDSLVNDVRLIDKWLDGNSYAMRLNR